MMTLKVQGVLCVIEHRIACPATLTLVVFRIPTGLRAWIEYVVVDTTARGKGAGDIPYVELCSATPSPWAPLQLTLLRVRREKRPVDYMSALGSRGERRTVIGQNFLTREAEAIGAKALFFDSQDTLYYLVFAIGFTWRILDWYPTDVNYPWLQIWWAR